MDQTYLCLSLVTTLRCAGLTQNQIILLLVPPALSALLSLFLIKARRNLGLRHWLLLVEVWIFLTLVLMDMGLFNLALDKTPDSDIFHQLSTAIGALSSLPLLLFTSSICLFFRNKLLPTIVPRLRTPFQCALFAFVPPIIALNELSSLYGITYHRIPALVVGYASAPIRSTSFVFASVEITLLAVLFIIVALICSIRATTFFSSNNDGEPLIDAESRVSISAAESTEIGWMGLAVTAEAVQTLLSLAEVSFPILMTRRVFVLFSRGCIFFGVVLSSAQLSVSSSSASIAAIRSDVVGTYLPPGTISPNDISSPANGRKQRVTVRYSGGFTAPTLEMRLSPLFSPARSSVSTPFTTSSKKGRSRRTRSDISGLSAHLSHSPGPSTILSNLATVEEQRDSQYDVESPNSGMSPRIVVGDYSGQLGQRSEVYSSPYEKSRGEGEHPTRAWGDGPGARRITHRRSFSDAGTIQHMFASAVPRRAAPAHYSMPQPWLVAADEIRGSNGTESTYPQFAPRVSGGYLTSDYDASSVSERRHSRLSASGLSYDSQGTSPGPTPTPSQVNFETAQFVTVKSERARMTIGSISGADLNGQASSVAVEDGAQEIEGSGETEVVRVKPMSMVIARRTPTPNSRIRVSSFAAEHVRTSSQDE
ncbi:hypothetical protein BOTBODRAFT_52427 [Botryobasidium botryosum FD-172 SS1]|uniref:Uncharacterized protein n=1 Tax=Botryobasidium botryosum (strain FD-172 SS1) TaxID=930990 RepID=A0A067N3P7_BOTB1|nr:hypothetical protein BOTBODRAFT_52427 [Botryobasidium botryosum FD-172 SS1]